MTSGRSDHSATRTGATALIATRDGAAARSGASRCAAPRPRHRQADEHADANAPNVRLRLRRSARRATTARPTSCPAVNEKRSWRGTVPWSRSTPRAQVPEERVVGEARDSATQPKSATSSADGGEPEADGGRRDRLARSTSSGLGRPGDTPGHRRPLRPRECRQSRHVRDSAGSG
jgi:hypothetical protein